MGASGWASKIFVSMFGMFFLRTLKCNTSTSNSSTASPFTVSKLNEQSSKSDITTFMSKVIYTSQNDDEKKKIQESEEANTSNENKSSKRVSRSTMNQKSCLLLWKLEAPKKVWASAADGVMYTRQK